MEFSAPKDAEIFIEQVLDRCKNLIISGIWDGLKPVQLDIWMGNFNGDTERYFATCVLDALIFRSEDQTIALMEQLFQRTLPDLLRRNPPAVGLKGSWLESLRTPLSGTIPPLVIVPVIRSNDPPTKSGPLLARLYRRNLSLNQDLMFWPWQVPELKKAGVTQFLFVDDFLGTGDQFCDFAKSYDLSSNLQGCYAVYAPLVAHKEGVDLIKTNVPSIHVVAVEVIDNRYNLFSEESESFNDGVNSAAAAKAFYDELIKRIQFPLRPDALRGYGKLSLAYAFKHATPDNCLPIIWSQGNNWKPLLER